MTALSIRALLRSALHINLLQVWQILARLVQMPVVIATIGLDGYGVWVLLYSICSYPTLLCTGVVWGYVKLTAELDARREHELLSDVVSTGVLLTTLIATAALAVLWIGRGVLLPLLGVATPMLRQAEWALAVLAASVLVDAAAGWGLYVLAGLQRMDLQYRLLTAGSMLEFVLSVSLLLAGWGVVGLALGTLANRVFCAGSAWMLCRSRRPMVRVSPRRANARGAQRLFGVGLGFASVALLAGATRESVRLAISALVGSAALGTYQLADRLLWIAGSPSHALLAPLMPAFANLRGTTDRAAWQELGEMSLRLVSAAALLPFGFVALFADAILFAWTGQRYADAVWTTHVLVIGELLAALAGVRIAALRASAVFEPEIRYRLGEGIATLAGLAGAAALASYGACVLAISGARSAAAWWFLRQRRATGDAPRVAGAALAEPLLSVTLALAAVYGLSELCEPGLAAATSRVWTIVGVLALATTGAAIAAAAAWWAARVMRK